MNSGIIRGYTEILSNDETWYVEPRFNYYSAVVGDRVYFEQTVALYDAAFSEDLFTSEFSCRITGFVDFTRLYMAPERGTLALLGVGLAGIGFAQRRKA